MEDPGGSGARECVIYFEYFVVPIKLCIQIALFTIFIFNSYYSSVRKTGYDKTKQPKDAGKSQATLSVGVLAYL